MGKQVLGLGEVLFEETTKRCKFAKAVEGLSEEDNQILADYLSDERVQSAGIRRSLDRVGIHIDVRRVSEHRNGDCSCDGGA